jgi:hypothetical protein
MTPEGSLTAGAPAGAFFVESRRCGYYSEAPRP